MYGLRIQQSRLVDANIFPLPSALWLVGDSVAVSLRCVWTRDRMMSFLRIVQVVLLLFILLSLLSSHGCFTCTHGHPHIPSQGPLKTPSHFAVHIHVSLILPRLCCGKPSEVVHSFPLVVLRGQSQRRRRTQSSIHSAICFSVSDGSSKVPGHYLRASWYGWRHM